MLKRAIAVSMAEGPKAGLTILDTLAEEPALRMYHLLPATRGDFLRRLERWQEAAAEYRRALSLVSNDRERDFLRAGLAECESHQAVSDPGLPARETDPHECGRWSRGGSEPLDLVLPNC
ncbi:MAG TPA: hypothetical protein VJX23_17045 [Candidatus Binataceae bacterium]|nr:hypothetical protein [Candidatus Binataceae bacterium]